MRDYLTWWVAWAYDLDPDRVIKVTLTIEPDDPSWLEFSYDEGQVCQPAYSTTACLTPCALDEISYNEGQPIYTYRTMAWGDWRAEIQQAAEEMTRRSLPRNWLMVPTNG